MSRNIIFIGGIHGVGKGTLCEKICEKFPFKHLTASEVLKWEEISEKENKKVEDFKSTQTKLIEGLEKIVKPDLKYLLDGHFCLLNKKGVPEKIPSSTFQEIQPKAMITLTCDVETILRRLNKRDNSIYKESVLEKMQELELSYSKEIASELKIPFLHVVGQNYTSLFNLLKSL